MGFYGGAGVYGERTEADFFWLTFGNSFFSESMFGIRKISGMQLL